MADELGAAVYVLAWLAAIFIPLEWARPMWAEQRRLRPGLLTDLAFFAGQHLLFGALVVAVLGAAVEHMPRPEGLLGLWASFAELPLLVRGAIAIILGDLAMYWGHRWQHRSPLLWRFHAIHHSSETLDFVAAHREHPLDGLYTQVWMNLPAVVLGVSFEGLLGLVAFRGLWATFIHSNVSIPLGPFALLFGSPQHHHLHHLRGREVGNYANLAPWLDLLFGTHVSAGEPARAGSLGLDEPAPRSYLALLIHPFRRRR